MGFDLKVNLWNACTGRDVDPACLAQVNLNPGLHWQDDGSRRFPDLLPPAANVLDDEDER